MLADSLVVTLTIT